MRVALAFLVAFAPACSSLVDTPCADGFVFRDGTCVLEEGPSVDAPTGVVADAPVGPVGPDAPTCTPGQTDPLNCGVCGRVCTSGICEDGLCVGELPGHFVLIGHDYRTHNAAMARVIGNAVALGLTHDVAIARVHGTAAMASQNGTTFAITQAMTAIGRPWHGVTPPSPGAMPVGIDVLVVDAQTGNGDAAQSFGATWKPTIDALLASRGVVIVLEGSGGVGHRFAEAAGLLVATSQDATGAPAFVVDASDAVVQQVLSPYLADSTSSAFPGVTGPIATAAGAVVVHQTR